MSHASTHLSRRKIILGLGVGSVAAAAVAAPMLTLRPAKKGIERRLSWWDRTFASLHRAGMDEWSQAVGEIFRLEGGGGQHILRIAAVQPFAERGERPQDLARSRAFAVVFEAGGSGVTLPGDTIYQLGHSRYPSLPVYMSPALVSGDKVQLIAVFN